MRTRCRGSFGRWPAPVDVQDLFAVRQFEHGQSLSQRIYIREAMKLNVSLVHHGRQDGRLGRVQTQAEANYM